MKTQPIEAAEAPTIRERLDIASKGRMKNFDGWTLSSLTNLGFTMDELHRFVAPRRTLARRIAKGEPLTVQENDSALRLVRMVEMADRVFGDPVKARRWLRKPNRGLDGVVPIDLLESETGAHLVEDVLQRIDHGIFA